MNPESKFHLQRFQDPVPGIRNPKCGVLGKDRPVANICSCHKNVCKFRRGYIFFSFHQITLKLGISTNFNAFFLSCADGYFSVKRRSLLHPKTAQRSFFSHYNLFVGNLKEKLARKARVNTDASI